MSHIILNYLDSRDLLEVLFQKSYRHCCFRISMLPVEGNIDLAINRSIDLGYEFAKAQGSESVQTVAGKWSKGTFKTGHVIDREYF